MELELGLGIPGNDHGGLDLNIGIRKRDFEEAFEELATLPLFRLKDDEEDDGDSHQQQEKPVGWPPIKYTRREVAVRRRGTCVKVKMEGMVIGRKVDLSLHRSYHHLFETLNDMFPKAHHPTVTYEDGEGDWMLVGDVPWEAFIKSAKRLTTLGLKDKHLVLLTKLRFIDKPLVNKISANDSPK